MSSTIGATAYVLPNDPWLFTPSSRNKLLRFDWPFTEGYENVPIGFDQTPPPCRRVLRNVYGADARSESQKLRKISAVQRKIIHFAL